MVLTEEEKKGLLADARSSKIREDLTKVARNRQNPFLVDGEIDVDRFLTFLNDFNAFINHQPKPFRKMIDKDMRL